MVLKTDLSAAEAPSNDENLRICVGSHQYDPSHEININLNLFVCAFEKFGNISK